MSWLRMTPRPIELPDTPPLLSKADADLMFRAELTLDQWMNLTDQQRADLRWRMGA